MVAWNSQLGASRALPTRATLPGFPLIDEAPLLPPTPSPTFLQRRWKNWKYTWRFIKIDVGAVLDLFGFLAFIISDYYLFPWELKRRRRVAMIARRGNEPPPLPMRRRALSLTNLDPSQNSPLLSLPREIRLQIYSHVIGYDLLHLTQLPKRLGHMRCTQQSSLDPLVKTPIDTGIFWDLNDFCRSQRAHGAYPLGSLYGYGEQPHYNATSDNSISLLQVSRQMYSDASHILYTTNTFEINHPQTLIFLDRTLLPHRMQSIRYLQIKWFAPKDFLNKTRAGRTEPDTVETWDQMCQVVLTKMTRLRHIRLVYTSFQENLENSLVSNLPLVFKLQCEERIATLETFKLWRQNLGRPLFTRVPDGFGDSTFC